MKYLSKMWLLTGILSAAMFSGQAQSIKTLITGKATLDAGTLVILECTEEIYSGQATVAQPVAFRVKMNVKAEGEVVIKSGAMAQGRIKQITRATANTEESYRIEVMYVQAVDGQMIPLTGQELILKGAYSSQAATNESGKTITAYVTNDIKIKS